MEFDSCKEIFFQVKIYLPISFIRFSTGKTHACVASHNAHPATPVLPTPRNGQVRPKAGPPGLRSHAGTPLVGSGEYHLEHNVQTLRWYAYTPLVFAGPEDQIRQDIDVCRSH